MKNIINITIFLLIIKTQAQINLTPPNSNNNCIWVEASSIINHVEIDERENKSNVVYSQDRGTEPDDSWNYHYGIFSFSVDKTNIETLPLSVYNEQFKNKTISLETFLSQAETNKLNLSVVSYLQSRKITYFYIHGNTVRVCKDVYPF